MDIKPTIDYTEVESEVDSESTSEVDSESDYEPCWMECDCEEVSREGRCNCKREPAWELDNAGEIKSTKTTIDINATIHLTKFHEKINTIPYFKSGKQLKLGQVTSRNEIVIGWTKDEYITLPTVKKRNKYFATDAYIDCEEELSGRVDLQPLFKQLAEKINEHFD